MLILRKTTKGELGEILSETTQPLPQSYPPTRSATRTYAVLGAVSAIISLFILPEIFGSAAVILGAYTWRKQQGNFGLYVLILGIIFMIIGIEVTAEFWLGGFLPE